MRRYVRGLYLAWASVPLVTALVAVPTLGTRIIGLTPKDALPTLAFHGEAGIADLDRLLEEANALAQEPAAGPPAEPASQPATPDGHGVGAGIPAPTEAAACPTTVQGLEDVATDLMQRRSLIGEREGRLGLREAALAEAESQLARRAEELDGLRRQLQQQLGQLAAQDDARIVQLVKVYETMKPKQAAEVFDRLDLDLLTRVASRMREVKMAAVLAAMDPEKARRVTVELARRRAPGAPGDG